MKYYFRLQVKRIGRWFEEFGVPPLIGYIGILILFPLACAVLFMKTSLAGPLITIIAILPLSSMSGVARRSFLKKIFQQKDVVLVRMVESLLCVLPFVLILIYYRQYSYTGILTLVAVGFPFLKIQNIQQRALPTPFSKYPFEFIAGIRTSIIPILAIHILLGIALYVNNRNLAVFTIALMFAIFSTYYASREVNYYVWIHNHTPSEFLIHKIKVLSAQSLLTSLPVTIIVLCYYPSMVLYVIFILMTGLAFVTSIMLSKYSFYPHNVSLGVSMALGLSLFFPPLLLVVLPYLYHQSLSNLRLYLPC